MAQDFLTKHSLLRHQTIDQEAAMYKPVREKERSSKCFVFVLAAFVICCAVLLAFASLLRLRSPEIKLRSATLNHASYNSASPSASFNATVITHFSITNPNYGAFSYENSTLRILYAGVKVGDREIRSNRVNGRETKEMNVSVNVKSSKLPVTGNLSSDINSGTLNLTSYAKFSGTVQLLKIFNKRKTIEMACIMNLNLNSHAIQGIQC